ncbi:MAG: hypothetical protein JWN73_368 [Betaproteobacteria bacterium]|nr:hypothetical protein [Betaproteobacteria bacterium]
MRTLYLPLMVLLFFIGSSVSFLTFGQVRVPQGLAFPSLGELMLNADYVIIVKGRTLRWPKSGEPVERGGTILNSHDQYRRLVLSANVVKILRAPHSHPESSEVNIALDASDVRHSGILLDDKGTLSNEEMIFVVEEDRVSTRDYAPQLLGPWNVAIRYGTRPYPISERRAIDEEMAWVERYEAKQAFEKDMLAHPHPYLNDLYTLDMLSSLLKGVSRQ